MLQPEQPYPVGYLSGVWDMFHAGHLNIILRARGLCRDLVVGVASDDLCLEVKQKHPVVPLAERMEVVAALDVVDRVVPDFTLDKLVAWRAHQFDVVFKGDDWRGTAKGRRLEEDMALVGVRVIYFPYTQHVSSTTLRKSIVAA